MNRRAWFRNIIAGVTAIFGSKTVNAALPRSRFASMDLLDVAKECWNVSNIKWTEKTPEQIAEITFQSTSDFNAILVDAKRAKLKREEFSGQLLERFYPGHWEYPRHS